ncbi:MAG: extracellular solute-binding protein [Clostridia bacterium]|nr:extracellular solute-binding protein [Clostridia bacterium]
MKKTVCLLLAALLAGACFSTLAACKKDATEYGELTLRICNWEDYISEDEETGKTLVEEFEEWYENENNVDIKVEYSTFGTNEILYNNLKINPGIYDLVCPSDYMIQKMMSENMLEKFGNLEESVPNYEEYGSPYMKNLFETNGWEEYAVPYMWGTMGYVYNPEFVEYDEAATWKAAINEKFKNKTTLKDSVRDTYFLGVGLAKTDVLGRMSGDYYAENGTLSSADYQTFLRDAFNDTTEETVEKVEKMLKQAKANAFSLEVDEGKNDMATGKVWLNFAWSGDAVFAMDEAEENSDTVLCYAVPLEGSNIWYDGWVMPKGANKKLAEAFVNFVSSPENACKNMDFIGYTSAIGGEEVFNRIKNSDYACEIDDEDAEEIDLTYFFGEINGAPAIVYCNDPNRQLTAQYPSEEITARCTVMEYFDDETNDRINSMWNRVKAGNVWLYVIIISAIAVVAAAAVVIIILAKKGVFAKKVKKGFTKIN